MTRNLKCVIFDLDGTLLNTLGTISETMNELLDKAGLPLRTQAEFARLVGWGAEKLVQDLFSSDYDRVSLTELYKSNLKKNSLNGTSLYEGMETLLDFLRDRKIPTAVLTNKPQDIAEKVCHHYLGAWEFDSIRGLKKGVKPKPDITEAMKIIDFWKRKPCECLYMGDTSLDMETAQRCGFSSVACTWGFREREELEQSGANWVFDTPLQVRELFKR